MYRQFVRSFHRLALNRKVATFSNCQTVQRFSNLSICQTVSQRNVDFSTSDRLKCRQIWTTRKLSEKELQPIRRPVNPDPIDRDRYVEALCLRLQQSRPDRYGFFSALVNKRALCEIDDDDGIETFSLFVLGFIFCHILTLTLVIGIGFRKSVRLSKNWIGLWKISKNQRASKIRQSSQLNVFCQILFKCLLYVMSKNVQMLFKKWYFRIKKNFIFYRFQRHRNDHRWIRWKTIVKKNFCNWLNCSAKMTSRKNVSKSFNLGKKKVFFENKKL